MQAATLRIALLLLAFLAPLAMAAKAEPAVTALEIERESGGLRLAIRSDGVMPFRIFQLTGPPRVIADFRITDWRVRPIPNDDLPSGAVALRFGLFKPGIGRVVIELDEPMGLIGVEADGGEVVMRLHPTSAQAFAAAAGWPEDARWEAGLDRVPEIRGSGPIIVAIDPGHGGVDPGAVVGGAVEKEIVMRFAERLAAALLATGRFQVFLTREGDVYVPLAERVRRARAAGAHILISFHADVVTEGIAEGASVYTFPRGSAPGAANRLAQRENRVDLLVGADLSATDDALALVLVELAQRATAIESDRLAEALVVELRSSVGVLRSRPHRSGAFMVLQAPDTPSVLVELGFLSSPADRAKLMNPEWHERAVGAVLRAIDAWVAEARPDFLRPRQP